MKLNKFLMAAGVASLTFVSTAFAAYTGSPTTGEIQFQGSLVNAACGLAPNSSPLTVDFGEITTSSLKDSAHAGNIQKNIELQGCDTTVAKTATVTYNPNTINPNDATLAAFTSGTANGAGIGMTDNGNKNVVWGQASTPVQLVNGATKIPFVAYLKADSASGPVSPGAFQSSINFQIDYQ